MLLSSIMLSFFTLFAKFATPNVPYFFLIFLRFFIPLILLMPILLWKNSLRELFKTNIKMQLLRVLCILIYQYSIFYYLTYSSLLNATVMQNTAPLFMPILEFLFFKYHFERRVVLSILISFAGVLCILQPDQSIFAKLIIPGFLASLGQAGSQVLFGHQAKKENQKSNLFYQFFLTSIASGIIYLIFKGVWRGSSEVDFSKTLSVWIILNLIGLGVASAINQTFRGLSYRHGRASAMAPFLYVSIIFSALLDWTIYHHVPNWLSLAGAILVIVGGLVQLYKKKSES